MKKLINQIFIIPILFMIFGLIAFSVFYAFFIEDLTKKEFKKVNDAVLKNEKKILEKNIKSIVDAVNGIRISSFKTTQEVLNEMLKILKKDYLNSKKNNNLKNFFKIHHSNNMFFYIISKQLVYPTFYQSFLKIGSHKYLIVNYKKQKYLSVEKKLEDGSIIGIAYRLNKINEMIKKEIIDFIKSINVSAGLNYVAIGEITNWYAEKGVFGKIIYHPIKFLIGKELNLDDPDVKGNFYKKEYFNCLKEHDGCFVTYYFKNPITHKFEPKISYFAIYRPYNYVFVKGFYYSQIIKDIDTIQKDIIEDVEELLGVTIALLLIFVLISFIVSYVISKRIIKQTIKQYDKLKNNYEKSQKELMKRVYFDKLTNLPNRNKLIEDIDLYDSLCLVDVDDFSDLNDIFGYEIGDKILILIANILTKKYKHVYRIGSDEFAIGFNYRIKEDDLREIVHLDIKFNDIKINLSVGASFMKGKLLETAETALKLAYKDKILKYKIYDEKIQQSQKERLEKLQQLLIILENEDIVPYYQCIVNNEQKILKYEALMRIKYENKILSPFEFMELIKEFKLYNAFSRIMIKKIFENLNKFDNTPVSINLSYLDISNEKTKKLIYSLLDKYENANVVFEILETENIEQFDQVVEFITHIKRKGIKVAIDDFGSGYSNLVNILYLKPDYLKIDASLIKNIDNVMYYEIVKFIVDFAKKFNIKTIAEFVSDKEKFEILKNLGIDEFQGFYFCKPRPIDELI
ncbi:EAL domain-containing protein [Nautilia lithotrophica]